MNGMIFKQFSLVWGTKIREVWSRIDCDSDRVAGK